MLLVREILGIADDPRFARRRVEHLEVESSEAAGRRLRRRTDAGTDVAVDLAAGSYLADGAVLADDGDRVVVVRRPREPALVVHLDSELPAERLVEQAVCLGHAFGNQHVPIEVVGCDVHVHLTTSLEVARATIERLGLAGARIERAALPLARHRPAVAGHGRLT